MDIPGHLQQYVTAGNTAIESKCNLPQIRTVPGIILENNMDVMFFN